MPNEDGVLNLVGHGFVEVCIVADEAVRELASAVRDFFLPPVSGQGLP